MNLQTADKTKRTVFKDMKKHFARLEHDFLDILLARAAQEQKNTWNETARIWIIVMQVKERINWILTQINNDYESFAVPR